MPLLRQLRPSDQHDKTPHCGEQKFSMEVIQLSESKENLSSLAVNKNIPEV